MGPHPIANIPAYIVYYIYYTKYIDYRAYLENGEDLLSNFYIVSFIYFLY